MAITCKDLAEKLLLFRDGELNAEQTEYLRQHLHLCPMCMDLLHSYDEVVDLLHELDPVTMPEGLMDRLKKRMAEG